MEQGMRDVSEAEVLAFMRQELAPEYDSSEAEYEAKKTDDGWVLTAKQMYEYVPFNSERLFKVCEFFNTMNVNDSRYAVGGCETCDYGSSYELTLYVKDGKPFPKLTQSTGSPE